MMRRPQWHSAPNRRRRGRRRFFFIVALALLVGIIQVAAYVEQHLKPPMMHLAKVRVKQMATEAINSAITAQVEQGKTADNLIEWRTDAQGRTSGFVLNYAEHMRITSDTLKAVKATMDSMSHFDESVPIGQALGSPLLAAYGPKIPLKVEPHGAIKVDLNTRQQDAGINMILVEVYIRITTEVSVVIPFEMQPQIVETEIPVSYLLVVGNVPMYYYDNQGKPVGKNGAAAPQLALPPHSIESSGAIDSSIVSVPEVQEDPNSSSQPPTP
ncbi:sporulation protein YunB [Paenibacillus polymyxa]|nr:sporulation protein YunB [Paenibacillus polymyxa]MDY8094747.1 sporulation protein YunB [Paenibacillus polymyxa]